MGINAVRADLHGNVTDFDDVLTPNEIAQRDSLANPVDLRNALLKRPSVFVRTFTKNLMAYALGRRVEYFDMPTVRAIERDAAQNDNRMSSFIKGVVDSEAFQMKRPVAVEDAPAGR